MTPLMPPMVNMTRNDMAKSIEVVKRIAPPHMVAIQLKIFTPVGTAMSMLAAPKTRSQGRAQARPRTCGAPRRRS